MLIADCHTHSGFSSDSETPVEAMVETAIAQGRKYYYLTDHHDPDYPVDEEGRDFILDMPAYLKKLEDLRGCYADKIQIRVGVELGLMKEAEGKIRSFYQQYGNHLDFTIGSSHLVGGKDPYYQEFYEGKTEKQAYGEYFDAILENVYLYQEFDIYGHLDYIVRYGPNKDKYYAPQNYRTTIQEILDILIKNGKGIEVNTGSLYKGFSFPHPHREILQLYRQMGGELITIGSDAHSPQYLGYGFEQAEHLLKELGFRAYCVYQKHEPQFIDLK